MTHQNENDQNQWQKQSEEEKKKDIFKGATKILIADFSFQQRPWRIGDAGMTFVKCWRENNWKLKIPFKNEDEIKTFSGKQEQKNLVAGTHYKKSWNSSDLRDIIQYGILEL